MKPEDIKNKRIAVLCDTIEKAQRFLGMRTGKYNYKMSSDLIFGFTFEKKNYLILERGTIHFRRKEWCELYGYKIITFEEFIKEDEIVRPLSAEEVLEVLASEYTSGKYDEIFGCDPYFEVLTSKFTPAEIVQKVTEWKRKQKQIQVTEDMVADALDEKYGTGKWRRE